MKLHKHITFTRVSALLSAIAVILVGSLTTLQAWADAVTHEVSSWAELETAVNNATDGDTIKVTKDIVATKTVNISGKSLTIPLSISKCNGGLLGLV